MECDKMRFIFLHILQCSPHTSYIGVAVLGSDWSKKLSTADKTSYELFLQTLVYYYSFSGGTLERVD